MFIPKLLILSSIFEYSNFSVQNNPRTYSILGILEGLPFHPRSAPCFAMYWWYWIFLNPATWHGRPTTAIFSKPISPAFINALSEEIEYLLFGVESISILWTFNKSFEFVTSILEGFQWLPPITTAPSILPSFNRHSRNFVTTPPDWPSISDFHRNILQMNSNVTWFHMILQLP